MVRPILSHLDWSLDNNRKKIMEAAETTFWNQYLLNFSYMSIHYTRWLLISHTSYVDHTIKVKNFSSLLFMLLCNQVFKYSIIVSPIVVWVVICLLSHCLETDLAIHTTICICFIQFAMNLWMVNKC
jgi:hypothetical protein